MRMAFSIKLEKRLRSSRRMAIIVSLASVMLAFLLGAVLLTVFDADPWDTYRAMLQGAFGTPGQFSCFSGRLRRTPSPAIIPMWSTAIMDSAVFRVEGQEVGRSTQQEALLTTIQRTVPA